MWSSSSSLTDKITSHYNQRDVFIRKLYLESRRVDLGPAACKSDRESGPLPFCRSMSVMMMVASEQFILEHLHACKEFTSLSGPLHCSHGNA